MVPVIPSWNQADPATGESFWKLDYQQLNTAALNPAERNKKDMDKGSRYFSKCVMQTHYMKDDLAIGLILRFGLYPSKEEVGQEGAITTACNLWCVNTLPIGQVVAQKSINREKFVRTFILYHNYTTRVKAQCRVCKNVVNNNFESQNVKLGCHNISAWQYRALPLEDREVGKQWPNCLDCAALEGLRAFPGLTRASLD